MTVAVAPNKPTLARWVASAFVVSVILLTVLTAPEPPAPDAGWRWATIALGLVNCGWNIFRAAEAFGKVGPISLVGFLQAWVLFTFSLPAVEMTYRYEHISLGYWRSSTDDPLVFQAALLSFIFQIVLFLVLGTGVEGKCRRVVRQSKAGLPQQRLAFVFLILLLPLVLARLLVLRGLGVSGAATAMVTRTDYFAQLDSGVSASVWALNTAFPVYAVVLGCLAVKFLVPHPSALGRRLFLLVLAGCAAGVALSGGRAEIVFVAMTVGVFMYVAGYRTARHYAPLMVMGLALAGLLFAVSQARHGEQNVLSSAADDTYVGNDYSAGDLTQVLGLGRFDAMVMILERHSSTEAQFGLSYGRAGLNGVDATFLPQITAGVDIDTPTVSGDVLGRWVFGGEINSVLPSAPGEGYINFGYAGILVSAVAIGLLTRGLIGLAGRLRGPQETTLILVSWTMARLLSDESGLIMTFAVRSLPLVLLVILLTASPGDTRSSGQTRREESYA